MNLTNNLRKYNVIQDIRYLLFTKFVLFSGLLSAVFIIINVINNRPLSNFITPSVSVIVCTISYFKARNQANYTSSRLLTFIYFSIILVPSAYLTSPGSSSAVIYLILMILFMIAILAVNRWEYLFSIFIIVETLILLRTEIWYPDFYYQYTDTVYRINDISINIAVVFIAILVVVHYMMKHYTFHNDELYKISITDSLTELYNRKFFFDFANKMYSQSKRYNNKLSIIFIDLNNFKNINDKFGHLTGDQVIKDIADIIKLNVRESDIAARYGGDEFIIMLPYTNEEGAKQQVFRLKEKFHTYVKKYIEQDFSVGIGSASSNDNTLDEIIALADNKLYENKKQTKENI